MYLTFIDKYLVYVLKDKKKNAIIDLSYPISSKSKMLTFYCMELKIKQCNKELFKNEIIMLQKTIKNNIIKPKRKFRI